MTLGSVSLQPQVISGARLCCELSLIPQMLGIVSQGAFRYLFFTLHPPLAGEARSAQLPFPIQHLGPPPSQPFHLEGPFQLLSSPFPEKPLQCCSVYTEGHNSLGPSLPQGPWGARAGSISQAWHQERVSAAGEEGKSVPPQRAMESSCVPGKQRQPCQCQQVTSGNVGMVPWLPAAPDVICLERQGWAGAASRWEKGFILMSRTGARWELSWESVAARLLIPAPFQSCSTPAAAIQLLPTTVRSLSLAEPPASHPAPGLGLISLPPPWKLGMLLPAVPASWAAQASTGLEEEEEEEGLLLPQEVLWDLRCCQTQPST